MALTHHPDTSTLLSFAAGTLSEPLAAVVATHADMCPSCRRTLCEMEEFGAALIGDLAPAELQSSTVPSLEAVAVPKTGSASGSARAPGADTPAVLAPLIGDFWADVHWKHLAPGVHHLPLPVSEGVGGDLRLLKVAPGQVMPEHGHGGAELTLVLRGSYRDEVGHFAEGDVADLDEHTEHQPVADKDEGCVCLIASEAPARFKGLVARLVQPITGL